MLFYWLDCFASCSQEQRHALKSLGKVKDAILSSLDAGLNINHQNKDGKTALMIAAEMSMTAVVTLLFKKGADLGIRNYVNNKNVVEIMLDARSSARKNLSHQYVTCRNHLVKKRYKQCLEFVDELYSKPMSLEKLSLVTVCSLIGPGGTREVKVKGIQLPVKFKEKLLFRTEDTLRHIVKEERRVTLAIPFIRKDFLPDSDSDD
ncbi:ankyrin repeat domain-containing protein 50-like isoform X2 [Biomphalaria glabrata]